MIKKVKTLKNIGLFMDYAWDNSGLQDFGQYNLVYGWNGSGKTTFSKFFSCIESGLLDEYPSLGYELDTDTGLVTQGMKYSKKIRVFNQDYIANNIQMAQGEAKPIYILGEENKVIADAILSDEKLLLEKNKQNKELNEAKGRYERDLGKLFTTVATLISSNTSGEATRRYDKRNAEAAFGKLQAKATLSETAHSKALLTLKQLEKPVVINVDIENIETSITQFIEEVKPLFLATVQTIIIDHLKQNADISEWVEAGVSLHQAHNSKKCEFCDNNLSPERLASLSGHFNDEDKKFKELLDNKLQELRLVYSGMENLSPPDKANFYEEIQSEYQSASEEFYTANITALSDITTLGNSLKEKKLKTTETITIDSFPNLADLNTHIIKLNNLINRHNEKTNNFLEEKNMAQIQLENHYLSGIFDEVDGFKTKINDVDIELKNIKDGDAQEPSIESLEERIQSNKAKVSSPHKACEELNLGLKTFLGRSDLQFEFENIGYLIKRRGKIAKNLSEGEKTAIAFVYFTIHLKDKEFNLDDGIVVIDDPISSLDSNSIYQAFSFLKNAVKDVKQVFLLTHNFDFLRLLLRWLTYKKLKSKSSFYMLKNSEKNGVRSAYISKLDKELENHESEYHYLFKLLYEFKSDGTIASAYHIPNIARKVLETFLMFRIPNQSSVYSKLEQLPFDDNKKTAIYKFVNDQSHITGKGFDPSLVNETQNNVKALLELIEHTFEDHHKILVEYVSGTRSN